MASAERNQTLVARRARAFVVRAFGDARVVHAGTIHRLQVLSRNPATRRSARGASPSPLAVTMHTTLYASQLLNDKPQLRSRNF